MTNKQADYIAKYEKAERLRRERCAQMSQDGPEAPSPNLALAYEELCVKYREVVRAVSDKLSEFEEWVVGAEDAGMDFDNTELLELVDDLRSVLDSHDTEEL